MNSDVATHVESFVRLYRDSAPEGWVRLVTWVAFLADDDGSVSRSGWTTREIAIVQHGDGPDALEGVQWRPDSQAGFEIQDLDEKLAGEPEEGWTILRVVIDRDGTYSADFSHESARPWEDAATDPFFDDVRDYLERNREEVEALVERLREQGDLPGSGGESRGAGRLGRLFGRQ